MNVNVILEDNSFIVEGEGKKLRVSFAEKNCDYADAMKFCSENGGGDESVENLRFIARHRDYINEQLKSAGKETLGYWYWTNEVTWWNKAAAFVVRLIYGGVDGVNMNIGYLVRAVSAL